MRYFVPALLGQAVEELVAMPAPCFGGGLLSWLACQGRRPLPMSGIQTEGPLNTAVLRAWFVSGLLPF